MKKQFSCAPNNFLLMCAKKSISVLLPGLDNIFVHVSRKDITKSLKFASTVEGFTLQGIEGHIYITKLEAK